MPTATAASPAPRRAVRRALLTLGAALLLLLCTAAPALAHARLSQALPADGEQLDELPERVRLTFDGPIEQRAGLRVFDSSGAQVDRGAVRQPTPEAAEVDLATPDVAQGSYVVTYAVTSADGHPIRGALVWTVGDGAVDEAVVAELFRRGTTTPPVLAVGGAVLRVAATIGLLLAAGAVIFLLVVHDGEREERRILGRVASVAAAAAVVGLLGGLAVQAAILSGRVGALVDPGALGGALGSRLGLATLLKTGGLLLVAVATWRLTDARRAALAATGASLAVLASPLSGHAAVTRPEALVAIADVAHVLAGAIWFGGLVCLAVVLRRRRAADDPVGGAAMIGRWSVAATAVVVVVGIAGLGLAWAQVRAWRALGGNAYGVLLLVKVAAVAVIMAVGAYNHRRLVPAVRRGHAGAWRLMARTVRTEALGLVLVLALTAVLTALVPARIAQGVTGAFTARASLGGGQTLDVTVDPNRAGSNEMHVYLFGPDGRPLDLEGTEVCATDGGSDAPPCLEIAFSQQARDIGPIVREPRVTGPGHWQLTGRELSIPGPWEIAVTARLDAVTEERAALEVVVND